MNDHSSRCYECFRPADSCFCSQIPSIENRTNLLIVQHRREKFHPFNTARIVRKALRNSSLLADHIPRLSAQLRFQPRACLLYPGPDSLPLPELSREQLPQQLVVLDGTWHHVKTLLRDIPVLQMLPRYQLQPGAPSRFRIRREPNAAALSTIEATITALKFLEPETAGWDELLRVFDGMVERQLAHPKSVAGWRQNRRRSSTSSNISSNISSNLPRKLLQSLANVVVIYGEPVPRIPGDSRDSKPPLVWLAERLGTGERFSCIVQSEAVLSPAVREKMELTESDVSTAISLTSARQAWLEFRRPTDELVTYSAKTARLLPFLRDSTERCFVLKSVDVPMLRSCRTLDEIAAALKVPEFPTSPLGRAGRRLQNALCLLKALTEPHN